MAFGFKKEVDSSAATKKTLVVIQSRCPQNHPCPSVRVCPVDALTQNGYDAPIVDQDKCTHCGKCVRYCPMRALTLA